MCAERVIAVHEAGHAVVGRALGLACGGAQVDPGRAITKNPYLLAHDRIAAGRPRAVRSAFRARLINAMAGGEATALIFGTQYGDAGDRRSIDRMASSPLVEIRDWARTEPRMRRACRRLVRRHRQAIELVADALILRGELTARQIDALVRASRVAV